MSKTNREISCWKQHGRNEIQRGREPIKPGQIDRQRLPWNDRELHPDGSQENPRRARREPVPDSPRHSKDRH